MKFKRADCNIKYLDVFEVVEAMIDRSEQKFWQVKFDGLAEAFSWGRKLFADVRPAKKSLEGHAALVGEDGLCVLVVNVELLALGLKFYAILQTDRPYEMVPVLHFFFPLKIGLELAVSYHCIRNLDSTSVKVAKWSLFESLLTLNDIFRAVCVICKDWLKL